MPNIKGQKGFTLIEIVMVIILLGILSAVAVPKFVNLSDSAHDAAIDGVFGAVSSALSIAIANNKAVPSELTAGTPSFKTEVHDNVSLSGDIAFSGWLQGNDATDGGANDATFVIVSGYGTGAGKRATVTYQRTAATLVPVLSMATAVTWP